MRWSGYFTAECFPAAWQEICAQMSEEFAAGHYEAGVLGALSRISAIACRCFPARGNDANELPDSTVLL
jgi:uncharacterized membrane protein